MIDIDINYIIFGFVQLPAIGWFLSGIGKILLGITSIFRRYFWLKLLSILSVAFKWFRKGFMWVFSTIFGKISGAIILSLLVIFLVRFLRLTATTVVILGGLYLFSEGLILLIESVGSLDFRGFSLIDTLKYYYVYQAIMGLISLMFAVSGFTAYIKMGIFRKHQQKGYDWRAKRSALGNDVGTWLSNLL